jgi:hypothetical protein
MTRRIVGLLIVVVMTLWVTFIVLPSITPLLAGAAPAPVWVWLVIAAFVLFALACSYLILSQLWQPRNTTR